MILHIASTPKFRLYFQPHALNLRLNVDAKFVGGSYEHYQGVYIINPKVTAQLMETKDKVMDDDVSIKEIYFNETENDYGFTVQIGEI